MAAAQIFSSAHLPLYQCINWPSMSVAHISLLLYVQTKTDKLIGAMLIGGHLVTLLDGLSQHNCITLLMQNIQLSLA